MASQTRILAAAQSRTGYLEKDKANPVGIVIFFSVYAKKDKANIDGQELQEARRLAAQFRALSLEDLRAALAAGTLVEINEGDGDAVTEGDDKT